MGARMSTYAALVKELREFAVMSNDGESDHQLALNAADAIESLLNGISEETRRAKANEDRANQISVMHGEKFTMLSELFARVRAALSPEEVKAWDLRIYGPGRPVRPHATGPAINTLEKP
jgi:hypothetical protein